MIALFILAAGHALTGGTAQTQRTVPAKPHMHYEIRINRRDEPLTALERLVRTCDLVTAISASWKNARDETLRTDLEILRRSACDLPKSH